MNKDPEAIKQLLAWLLQDLSPMFSAPSGENFSHQAGLDESGGDQQLDNLDLLDSEAVDSLTHSNYESSHFPVPENSSLKKSGDMSAVQDRFHALLKRRLSAEIERHPPLFPWETEVCEYEAEVLDEALPERVPASVWLNQLQHLSLPVPMPEQVLKTLLQQCQEVVQSSLKEGVKLVQAVENLFPGQSQVLNQMAGVVLAAPLRSGETGSAAARWAEGQFPSRYDHATPTQQMALSLLAAREIMETLTLSLTPAEPRLERQWLTQMGNLRLEAEYQVQRSLRIQVLLPCEGHLSLQGGESQAMAQRSAPGCLSVELFDPSPGQTYLLDVQLADAQEPLRFVISPM